MLQLGDALSSRCLDLGSHGDELCVPHVTGVEWGQAFCHNWSLSVARMRTRLRTPLLALAREVLESSGADYVALFGRWADWADRGGVQNGTHGLCINRPRGMKLKQDAGLTHRESVGVINFQHNMTQHGTGPTVSNLQYIAG